jgi:hypothetical protein
MVHSAMSTNPFLTIDSGDSIRLQTPGIQWGYSSSKDEERVVLKKPKH